MCTSPKKAWIPRETDKQGKKTLLFKPPVASKIPLYEQIEVPCNKCIACEKLRALRTAVQMACELNTTELQSWFFTLTYDDEHLPDDFSVHLKDIQLFHKKLRKHLAKNKQPKIRIVTQGEYGGKFQRPHYHDAIFNLEIDDLQKTSSKGNYPAYISETINKIWEKGQVHIIELVFENCLYISTHHLDEKVDKEIKIHLQPVIHPVTGELIKERNPEFSTRSSRPAIGKAFFEKYYTDIYPHDYTVKQGQKMPVPKYFDKLLKDRNPEMYEQIKQKRSENIKQKSLEQNRYQARFNKEILRAKK